MVAASRGVRRRDTVGSCTAANSSTAMRVAVHAAGVAWGRGCCSVEADSEAAPALLLLLPSTPPAPFHMDMPAVSIEALQRLHLMHDTTPRAGGQDSRAQPSHVVAARRRCRRRRRLSARDHLQTQGAFILT